MCPVYTPPGGADLLGRRAAFTLFWEGICGSAVPIEGLRKVLEPPVPIKTVLQFSKSILMQDAAEIWVTKNTGKQASEGAASEMLGLPLWGVGLRRKALPTARTDR